MKNTIIIYTLILILALGHENSAQNLKVNGLAGTNFSIIDGGDGNWDFRGGIGFQMGFSLIAPINDQLEIESRLIFKQKNSIWESRLIYEDGSSVPTENRFSFSYFEIPALLHLPLSESLDLTFGPVLDIKIGNSLYDEDGNSLGYSSGKPNALDYGLIAGFSYDIKKLTLGLEYNKNFNNLFGSYNSRFGGFPSDFKFANSISLNIGYILKE